MVCVCVGGGGGGLSPPCGVFLASLRSCNIIIFIVPFEMVSPSPITMKNSRFP